MPTFRKKERRLELIWKKQSTADDDEDDDPLRKEYKMQQRCTLCVETP